VELQADDPEDYPLLVLAGGSTARKDEDPSDNTLRDIRTEPNGQLKIRTFEQGILQNHRNYQEPLPILKRRAFVGATERAKIVAEELYSEVVIDGVGHLRGLDRTSGLRVASKAITHDGMVIHVTVPLHGKRLQCELEDSCRDTVTLSWRDAAGKCYELNDDNLPQDRYCWLRIIQPLKSGSEPLTYGVQEAATNSIAMTRWELAERSRHKKGSVNPDYEEVGFNITYPVKKLVLHLQFPAELDGITPEVRCYRHPEFPNFPLRFRPDQRPRDNDPKYLPDPDLMDEESKRLRYEADKRRWILEIDRPVAGNKYTLRWRVPDLMTGAGVVRLTEAYQKRLLALKHAPGAFEPPEILEKCREIFVRLAVDLMKRFASKITPYEKLAAFLMVYDRSSLCLRPVLTHVSSGDLPEGSYELPLGEGVAGAAFLRRRIVTWLDDPASGSLIKPPFDNLNSRWVLALPIFYQECNKAGEPVSQTLPGALIGVITLGSDEISSRISECYPEDETAKELGQEAQILAQQCVFDILAILRPSQAPSGGPQAVNSRSCGASAGEV